MILEKSRPTVDKYEWIRRCALMMAYDSGCIDREQTEEQWLEATEPYLTHLSEDELGRLDRWLGRLSPDQRVELMTGEYSIVTLERTAPRRERDDWLLTNVFSDML